MDRGQNYFADDTDIGVTSPTTPTFGRNSAIRPWYPAQNMYNSPGAYADEVDDYMTRRGSYSWSSNEAAATASPIASTPSFSTCISPTTMAFQQQQEPYAQWSVGEWQPSFDRDGGLDMSSPGSDDPAPPPPKKHKSRSSQRGVVGNRGLAKSTPALTPPAPPPNINPETPPSPPTTPPERVGQLRTASRRAKRTSAHKPAASEEERRARASHNLVEKQYRNRLNAQFERLLAVLPPPGSDDDGATDDRRLSKAEVLDIARRRIKALEKERDSLKVQKKELTITVGRMRDAIMRQRRDD